MSLHCQSLEEHSLRHRCGEECEGGVGHQLKNKLWIVRKECWHHKTIHQWNSQAVDVECEEWRKAFGQQIPVIANTSLIKICPKSCAPKQYKFLTWLHTEHSSFTSKGTNNPTGIQLCPFSLAVAHFVKSHPYMFISICSINLRASFFKLSKKNLFWNMQWPQLNCSTEHFWVYPLKWQKCILRLMFLMASGCLSGSTDTAQTNANYLYILYCLIKVVRSLIVWYFFNAIWQYWSYKKTDLPSTISMCWYVLRDFFCTITVCRLLNFILKKMVLLCVHGQQHIF